MDLVKIKTVKIFMILDVEIGICKPFKRKPKMKYF